MLKIGYVSQWSPELVQVASRMVETGQCEDDQSGSKRPMKISVAFVPKDNQCNWHFGMVGPTVVGSGQLPGISSVNLSIEIITSVIFVYLSGVDINPSSKVVRMHEGIICQK